MEEEKSKNEKVENEALPINKNIIISGYEHFISKSLVNWLTESKNKVTYIIDEKNILLEKMLPAYLIKRSSETFYKVLEGADILYVLDFANNEEKISSEKINNFYSLLDDLNKINKKCKIVLLSSSEIYGNRKETCFIDTTPAPKTYNGNILSNIEKLLLNSEIKYSIIRSPEILTKQVYNEITDLLNIMLNKKTFYIPKTNNYINFVSQPTVISALLIGAIKKENTIYNLTETNKLTLLEFFEKLYLKSKEELNYNKPKKYINYFIWKNKIQGVPKFLLTNQRLSIIEAETDNIMMTWNTDLIIKKIMYLYKKKFMKELLN